MSNNRTHTMPIAAELLQPGENCKFVDVEEFCNLAVSRRNLIRCDETEIPVRGLLDPQTGVRYLIEEADLFQNCP